MLYQIHHEFREEKRTEMCVQFRLEETDPIDEQKRMLNEQMDYVNQKFPLPSGAKCMLCNEESPDFWKTHKEEGNRKWADLNAINRLLKQKHQSK